MSAPGPQPVAVLVHWEPVQVEARRIGGIDIEDPCFALQETLGMAFQTPVGHYSLAQVVSMSCNNVPVLPVLDRRNECCWKVVEKQ